jgi:hypothetical protein
MLYREISLILVTSALTENKLNRSGHTQVILDATILHTTGLDLRVEQLILADAVDVEQRA